MNKHNYVPSARVEAINAQVAADNAERTASLLETNRPANDNKRAAFHASLRESITKKAAKAAADAEKPKIVPAPVTTDAKVGMKAVYAAIQRRKIENKPATSATEESADVSTSEYPEVDSRGAELAALVADQAADAEQDGIEINDFEDDEPYFGHHNDSGDAERDAQLAAAKAEFTVDEKDIIAKQAEELYNGELVRNPDGKFDSVDSNGDDESDDSGLPFGFHIERDR